MTVASGNDEFIAARGPNRPHGLLLLFLATLTVVLLGGERSALCQRIGLKDVPPSAARLGKHCLGTQDQKLILEHYVAGSINPLGLENQLRLSVCTPLVEKPGLLYDFTNIEAGFANYISPTHIHAGFFGTITPLSFIVFKAEVTGFYIWPLGGVFPGAGVNIPSRPDCQASYDDVYPPTDASQAYKVAAPATPGYGLRALLGTALQGSVPLGKRMDLLLYDGLNTEFWRYSQDTCVFVARRDVGIRGSGDWIVANTAVLALAFKIRSNYTIRVGATDDLVYTPSNGYLGNLAAGLISFGVDNLRGLARNFAFFVRVGTFTSGFRKDGADPANHCLDASGTMIPGTTCASSPDPIKPTAPVSAVTIALGLDVYYELAKRPTRRATQATQAVPEEPPQSPPAAPAAPSAEPSGVPAEPVSPTASTGTTTPAPAQEVR